MWLKVLSSFLVITFLFDKGLTLNCYQCDSSIHSDCKEKLDHSNLDRMTITSDECKVDASEYCIKTTGVWGGIVGTRRFCSSRHMGNQCQYLNYADHDRMYRACVFTCQGDACNTSSSLTTSIATVLVSSIFVLLKLLY